MNEIRAIVDESSPERVLKSPAELDQTLAEAASQAQAAQLLSIVFLHASNGDWLSLVVGGEETVLGFNGGDGNPPYYASAGEAATDEPVLTAYAGMVHHAEFPRRWVVSMSLGRRAASEFLVTGTRPTSVEMGGSMTSEEVRESQVWTEADFDTISWYDNHIHAFRFVEGSDGAGDLTGATEAKSAAETRT